MRPMCGYTRSDVDPDTGMANFADLFVATIAQVEPSEGPFRDDGFPPYQMEYAYDTPASARNALQRTARCGSGPATETVLQRTRAHQYWSGGSAVRTVEQTRAPIATG
jgi:hypothetical protein